MGRSGYSDDYDEMFPNASALFQANVDRAIKGKRGRFFLVELAKEMDAMQIKRLIADDLVTPEGECCTMGVVFKARGVNTDDIEPHDADVVAAKIGIPECLAREIAFENDDDFNYVGRDETPEQRWIRMRKWVAVQLGQESK